MGDFCYIFYKVIIINTLILSLYLKLYTHSVASIM